MYYSAVGIYSSPYSLQHAWLEKGKQELHNVVYYINFDSINSFSFIHVTQICKNFIALDLDCLVLPVHQAFLAAFSGDIYRVKEQRN